MLPPTVLTRPARPFVRSWASASRKFIRIVEVGPRDGLQNEKKIVPRDVKVELISRLGNAGLSVIEAGSFVSPKWVPQMADTNEVLSRFTPHPGVRYPVLVPNGKGLMALLELIASSGKQVTDEIAVFTTPSEGFSLANTNCSVAESLERLATVTRTALDNGLRIRGYVSMCIASPFEGEITAEKVRDVAKALVDMGCYEISLGDTTGMGTPMKTLSMLNTVMRQVNVELLATHNHDTFGMGIANIMAAISAGVRVVDSSVAGLGGCPYSPGATGNVATEDVVYALHGDGWETGVDLNSVVETGNWISETIGVPNASRAGRAWHSRKAKQ